MFGSRLVPLHFSEIFSLCLTCSYIPFAFTWLTEPNFLATSPKATSTSELVFPNLIQWRAQRYQLSPFRVPFISDGSPLDLSEATELHLYVCAACPWAHHALITRNLSATLRSKVAVSIVSPFRDDSKGWEFLSDSNSEVVSQFPSFL